MREAYRRVLDSIDAGYDFWFILPQLEKLKDGICIDKNEETTEIFFHGPGPMAVVSDMVEIVNGKEYPRAAYPEMYREFMAVIRAWANEPETSTIATSTVKFRDDLQPLADFMDAHQGLSTSELAKAYRDSLKGKNRNPVESYKSSIEYIRRVRRRKG